MNNPQELCIAVVGATGAVGREMVSILKERAFPLQELRVYASERSLGQTVSYGDDELDVEVLDESSLKDIDIALWSAGSEVSGKFAPAAAAEGTIVIDNSSCFRMQEQVPLIVPEVNLERLHEEIKAKQTDEGFIISNPNCVALPLSVVLKPILDAAGIERVVASTYQSVSGAGQKGIKELWEQTVSLFSQQELPRATFPHRIAFNCIPQIGSFDDSGDTEEEFKICQETSKILGLAKLPITVTAVRVPVFVGHGISVNVQTSRALSPADAKKLLGESPGVIVTDSKEERYPIPTDVAGSDATYIGRIRKDQSVEHGLNLWVMADNLRKGAALNAVEIAEAVVATYAKLH